MQQYQRIAYVVCAALLLLPAAAMGAPLPEGLENVLRVHNFNMYSAPCPANNMTLRDVNGRTVDLSAFRGKVVILNFWKIDCPPCRSEKKVLERIFRKYGDRGLEIVAVNLFDDFNRLKSFAQKSGFGFTMCGDPERSFCVRRQPLPNGEPTTFVVNARSEAIYEVPAVPTTYLIDRSGNVVGNSVGSVNWEDAPLGRLLECMLGSPQPKFARAASQEVLSDASGTGDLPIPKVRAAGPTQRGATDGSSEKAASEDVLASPQKSARPGGQKTEAEAADLHSRSAAKGKSHASKAEVSPRSQKAVSLPRPRSADNPQRIAQLHRGYSTPKPYQQGAPSAAAQRPPRPYVAPSGSVPPPVAPKPYGPPAVTSSQPLAPKATGSPSPLPAAIPYTPPRFAAKPGNIPPVTPDKDGTVMARVAPPEPVAGERQGGLAQSPSGPAPLSQPSSSGNALQELILDSFNRGSAPGQLHQPQVRPVEPLHTQRQTQATPVQPAGSVFSQVGRDFQNLGAGIGEVFSKFWPSKR